MTVSPPWARLGTDGNSYSAAGHFPRSPAQSRPAFRSKSRLLRTWSRDSRRYHQTQPASALSQHSGRRQPRTPPPATPPISRRGPRPPADSRRESEPLAAMSGEFVPAPLVPAPCCAESKFSRPGASDIPHRLAGLRSRRSRCRRTPSRAPATLASRSTTPRDERRRAPSQPSAPNSSNRPSDADAPVRAAESGSVRPQRVPASPIPER